MVSSMFLILDAVHPAAVFKPSTQVPTATQPAALPPMIGFALHMQSQGGVAFSPTNDFWPLSLSLML
jgi:hypothetical protein